MLIHLTCYQTLFEFFLGDNFPFPLKKPFQWINQRGRNRGSLQWGKTIESNETWGYAYGKSKEQQLIASDRHRKWEEILRFSFAVSLTVSRWFLLMLATSYIRSFSSIITSHIFGPKPILHEKPNRNENSHVKHIIPENIDFSPVHFHHSNICF